MESEVFLFLLLLLSRSIALDLDVVEREGITVGPSTAVNAIDMYEHLPVPFRLATFRYTGTEVNVRFSLPNTGANSNLGLTVEKIDGVDLWEVTIHNDQDYESSYFQSNSRLYYFVITAGSDPAEVSINIVNINDNAPIVRADTPSCEIVEHEVALTDCSYTISDLDGHLPGLSWTMSDYDETFAFQFETAPQNNDVKEVSILLRPLKELDYEETTLYVMDLFVEDTPIIEGYDYARNSTTKVVVAVQDIADTNPVWTSIFASQQFDELEPQNFRVAARDGDLGIDDEIFYYIETNWSENITIDRSSGEISVLPIDRDAAREQMFPFDVFACEVNMVEACVNQTIAFLVTDINNQKPLIYISSNTISIPENFYGDLNLEISANDLDSMDNAMYDIILTSEGNQHTAFTIAPSAGFQLTSIYLYITNFRLLDYELEEWREFTLTITTTDQTPPYNTDFVQLTVSLLNLNDEIPQFQNMPDNAGYIADVDETVPAAWPVFKVEATDRDIGDKVRYSLLGTYINNILSIDEETGEIRTRIDGAFDFETQEEVILQVQATDTLRIGSEPTTNSAIAQITIRVADVNDETPRITVDSQRIEITENLEHDTPIVNETTLIIIATDDDENASLTFSINWDNTYATKTGVRITEENFHHRECIRIETQDHTTSSGRGKSAKALLYINEVLPDNTPDYEQFDILYLNVMVTDSNQDVGDDSHSVTVPIYIRNENDEPPVFAENTIHSRKTVVENSINDTTIAIIIATDVDSPEISYELIADDSEYEGLVSINDVGEIYVSGEIDADLPLYYMTFTVIASDGEFHTPATIVIEVLDENDNDPKFKTPSDQSVFLVAEQIDHGYSIAKLLAEDIDRDPINHVVAYRFGNTISPTLNNFFNITGDELVVYYANPENKLDRDRAIPAIDNTIIIEAYDNNRNNPRMTTIVVTVRLTDINNKAPVITTTQFTVDESYKSNDVVGLLVAQDEDEEGSPNTRVNFAIKDIRAVTGAPAPSDMFVLQNHDAAARTVDLVGGRDLRNYHGTYEIDIETKDEGTTPGPLDHLNTITVVINKYNFVPPIFTFPDGSKILLKTDQSLNGQLYLYNDQLLNDVSASDGQDDKYSIGFIVTGSDVFDVVPVGERSARLILTAPPDDNVIQITLTAQAIDALPTLTTDLTVEIQFVDSAAEPIFDPPNVDTISFLENTTGLSSIFHAASFKSIPEELIDEYPVFYLITADDDGGFTINNKTENRVAITTALDREEKDTYTIQIQSSRTEDGIANPQPESVLTITIHVLDINDNPPNFVQEVFFASINSTSNIGDVVGTVTAIDLDIEDKLTYSIEGYVTIPDNINTETPFRIDPDTGEITTLVSIPDNANGYFLFNVSVNDGEHSDHAQMHVYIMSEAHRVEFVFKNDLNTVNAARVQIENVLQSQFGYRCVIGQVLQNTDENGNAMDDETVVRVHFVDAALNEPINKEVIENSANDIQIFSNLVSEFQRYDLFLIRFLETRTVTENMEEVLRAWLIGITVVLGTLCVLLLVAFILKTRSLSRRLNKLSVIRYGSQESVSNRRQAPTTNKHAIEGSNPAYNEDKIKSPENDDTVSVDSGDSDLVGVENNPEFDYKYEKQGGGSPS